MRHGVKRLEDLFHLRPLVGKQRGRIHRVKDHRGPNFEHQQPAIPRLGAIDRQIFELGVNETLTRRSLAVQPLKCREHRNPGR